MRIKPLKEFKRMVTPPPDKSITIRAAIMGSIAQGKTVIENPLLALDAISAINAVSAYSKVDFAEGKIIIEGGIPFSTVFDAGNSGTTMRLLAGLVAGYKGEFTFRGDRSLSGRSMRTLFDALTSMGSHIKEGSPFTISGGNLNAIDFVPSAPSAQIKSAVLLAGLNADGVTRVTEKVPTRRHTEDMLAMFGADLNENGNTVSVSRSKLTGCRIDVPGDISAAAYPIVLALNKGFCYLRNVGNSRRELIDFLKSIGADIKEECYGDRSDLTVHQSKINSFCISGALSTALIDELPLLAVAACFANGESTVSDAHALKNKECDRIKITAQNIRALGGDIVEKDDGWIIRGGGLKGGAAVCAGDHRMAMSMAVANALSLNGGTVDDEKIVDISYPSFWELFL